MVRLDVESDRGVFACVFRLRELLRGGDLSPVRVAMGISALHTGTFGPAYEGP